MQIINTTTEERVITLKEITDLIGARHNDSMRKVEELAKEEGFGTLRKIRSVYNSKGQTIETYHFTKKQAIAVGARLNNAMLMKVINRLEELESKKPIQLTSTEILAQMALRLVELERNEARIAMLENDAQKEHQRANRLENNIRRTITDTNHFTIIGYANLKGIDLTKYHTGSLGRKATKLSKDKGYIVTSVPDSKYGKIGVYHKDIIKEVFETATPKQAKKSA